jgi:hypothetical protein
MNRKLTSEFVIVPRTPQITAFQGDFMKSFTNDASMRANSNRYSTQPPYWIDSCDSFRRALNYQPEFMQNSST